MLENRVNLLPSGQYTSTNGGLFEGGGLFHKNYFRVDLGAYSRTYSICDKTILISSFVCT